MSSTSCIPQWRQGSCLSSGEHSFLKEHISSEHLSNSDFLVAITHSCSIVHHDFSKEPHVEYLVGKLLPGSPDGNLTKGKNPRKLHCKVLAGTKEVWAEFNVVNRGIFNRQSLHDVQPSTEYILSEITKNLLMRWLAHRYDAPAFPNNFNNRMRAADKRVGEILKNAGADTDLITGFFIYLEQSEDELGENEPYEVEFFLTVGVNIKPHEMERCESICSQIKDIYAQALKDNDVALMGDGISIKREDKISLHDLRGLKPYGFDYLSETHD